MPRSGKANRFGQAVLELNEMAQLFAKLGGPYRVTAQICYFTTGRTGEAIALLIKMLKLAKEYVSSLVPTLLPKGGITSCLSKLVVPKAMSTSIC